MSTAADTTAAPTPTLAEMRKLALSVTQEKTFAPAFLYKLAECGIPIHNQAEAQAYLLLGQKIAEHETALETPRGASKAAHALQAFEKLLSSRQIDDPQIKQAAQFFTRRDDPRVEKFAAQLLQDPAMFEAAALLKATS